MSLSCCCEKHSPARDALSRASISRWVRTRRPLCSSKCEGPWPKMNAPSWPHACAEDARGSCRQGVFCPGPSLPTAIACLRLGLTSPRGNRRRRAASLQGRLANPAYPGTLSSGRTRGRPARLRRSATPPLGKPAHSQEPTPPASWTLVTTLPALGSQEDGERVQAQLARTQQRASRNHQTHADLFRALGSCGGCQSACMARTTKQGHRDEVCRWAAQPFYSPHDHRGTARDSPAQPLDALVWQALCALLTHPEGMASAWERAPGSHGIPHALQARQAALRKGQRGVTTQLDRRTEAYLQGVIPFGEYQRRRQELEPKPHALATQEKP